MKRKLQLKMFLIEIPWEVKVTMNQIMAKNSALGTRANSCVLILWH